MTSTSWQLGGEKCLQQSLFITLSNSHILIGWNIAWVLPLYVGSISNNKKVGVVKSVEKWVLLALLIGRYTTCLTLKDM